MNPAARSLLESLENWRVPTNGAWPRTGELIEKHASTEFGRAHHFETIRTPEDFREAVPVMDYGAHSPWIQRAAAGEKQILACDDPIGFEKTSGTTSGAKWIPITLGLQGEFARGLASWLGDWQHHCPEVFEGRAYWAISPAGMTQERTPGGLPLGMPGDAAYFPAEIGGRLAEWMVIPQLGGDPAHVFDETADLLLETPDLSLVSVWSPTFLLAIDAALQDRIGAFSWRDRWPELARVSCWADASSAPWIPRVRERLGGIPIEPKGLLATEGITSLPDSADSGARLASECHWHEFIDEDGRFTPVSDLRINGIYEILLTTAGGLFRYRSGDRVNITGRGNDGLPQFRFIGRTGIVSDLVGEKLHENQVIDAFIRCSATGFLVAAPDRPGYDLWLEEPAKSVEIQICLRENPYFDQAHKLGQLAPMRTQRLADGWSQTLAIRLSALRGCRIGDVKPPILLTRESPEEIDSWLA